MQIRKLSVPGFQSPLDNVWLTPREQQVLRLVQLARVPKVIARELRISPFTVRDYIANMMTELGLSTRGELMLWGLANPSASREGCTIVGIVQGGDNRLEDQGCE